MIKLDISGPLPASENNFIYILVIVCHFSKWVELFPLKNQTAEEVADCLFLCVCRHEAPEFALSDQGTNFKSEVMSILLEKLDIHRLRTSAYHPQWDGTTERFNRTLEQMLTCYVPENQKTFPVWLSPTTQVNTLQQN
ncbi:unnamed protein product [Brachionus calyciflorus]|uniref:Integrase catalytic domain-containing protein n=1 Tax=Brachionus calyciflorus TaxID=104777 RepID=A0A813QBW8_9BILA|nr:unnamed protein product [Brachionus calyciflorus]